MDAILCSVYGDPKNDALYADEFSYWLADGAPVFSDQAEKKNAYIHV